MKRYCKAFSFAEILITLTVIGVIAALTLPAITSEINKKTKKHRMNIIENKLIEGLNLYNNLENGLSGVKYSDSYDFLLELSKHYKMSKICKIQDLRNCFPYKEIHDEDEIIDISSVKSAKSLGLSNDFYEPAGFVSGEGTPFIFALKKDCYLDSDKLIKKINENSCYALLYDINGSKKPNTVGKDIIAYNGIYPKGYFIKIGGVKIFEPATLPERVSSSTCHKEIEKNYGITKCYESYDAWAGAMINCNRKNSHLAKSEELAKIISGLLYDNQGKHPTINENENTTFENGKYKVDEDLISSLGFSFYGYTSRTFWTYEDYSKSRAGKVYFNKNTVGWGNNSLKTINSYLAICVINPD